MPILYMWGSETLPVFKEGKDLFHTWFPQAEDRLVQGVGHSLQMQDPSAVAEAIADFLRRHPLEESADR